MRKNFLFFLFIACLLILPVQSLASTAEAAQPVEMDWAWLVEQVASGVDTITLINRIECDSDEGLAPVGSVTIDGAGFAIEGAIVDSGTVYFKNITLEGVHGIDDEDGGAALTVRGEGTKVILSGNSSVVGGRSGLHGIYGGAGIVLQDKGQWLILRNKVTVLGGAGLQEGGSGIVAQGCGSSVLITDSAIAKGADALVLGGMGVDAPGCCKISFQQNASAIGGRSMQQGGHGVRSLQCAVCGNEAAVSISGVSTLFGGIGWDGGSAVYITRTKAGDTAYLQVNDGILSGADGGTAGLAIYAAGVTVAYSGTPVCYGGGYYQTESQVILLEGCQETGDVENVEQIAGERLAEAPTNAVQNSLIAELNKKSSHYETPTIDDGLLTRDLATKYEGFTVDKGSVGQASLNGNGLKINMYNSTMEKRMYFRQRLMSDGGEGIRLVLIADHSDGWLIVESTVAALRKLGSMGFTQLAFTTVEPVYYERIVDIAALLEAIDADGAEPSRILLGTMDDCVIFVREDKTWDYQEGLMEQLVRPLEPLEEIEKDMEVEAG